VLPVLFCALRLRLRAGHRREEWTLIDFFPGTYASPFDYAQGFGPSALKLLASGDIPGYFQPRLTALGFW
jgi:hypothetical protein